MSSKEDVSAKGPLWNDLLVELGAACFGGTEEVSIDGEGKVSTQAKDQLQPEYILSGTCVAHKLYCCKAWADTGK